MVDSPSPDDRPLDCEEDMLEMNTDLERLIDAAEDISVHLSWMAYDMVALQTNPEVEPAMRNLEEAWHKCRALVYAKLEQEQEQEHEQELEQEHEQEHEPEPEEEKENENKNEKDKCDDPDDTALTQM